MTLRPYGINRNRNHDPLGLGAFVRIVSIFLVYCHFLALSCQAGTRCDEAKPALVNLIRTVYRPDLHTTPENLRAQAQDFFEELRKAILGCLERESGPNSPSLSSLSDRIDVFLNTKATPLSSYRLPALITLSRPTIQQTPEDHQFLDVLQGVLETLWREELAKGIFPADLVWSYFYLVDTRYLFSAYQRTWSSGHVRQRAVSEDLHQVRTESVLNAFLILADAPKRIAIFAPKEEDSPALHAAHLIAKDRAAAEMMANLLYDELSTRIHSRGTFEKVVNRIAQQNMDASLSAPSPHSQLSRIAWLRLIRICLSVVEKNPGKIDTNEVQSFLLSLPQILGPQTWTEDERDEALAIQRALNKLNCGILLEA